MTNSDNQSSVKLMSLANPIGIRAEMARRGLLCHQLLPYEDPERGRVVPLCQHEVQVLALDFLDKLEMACRRAEQHRADA